VSVQWVTGEPGVFTCHRGNARHRDDLVDKIAETAGTDWWAVDVPFGWPDAWADFLSRHANGPAHLPPGPPDDERPWSGVARRATDRHVTGQRFTDRSPTLGFSVTFDKLGATAAAWSWIEWQLQSRHRLVIDRAGVTEKNKVCETYPAAAWRKWFTTGNPTSVSDEEFQGHLGAILRPDNGCWTITPHERDALICACIARARATDRTDPIPPNLLDQARREGWIHLQREDVTIANLSEH
jgi:hypothetical protein